MVPLRMTLVWDDCLKEIVTSRSFRKLEIILVRLVAGQFRLIRPFNIEGCRALLNAAVISRQITRVCCLFVQPVSV